MVERILVLDVGTSALKAVLFDQNGAILASSEAGYRDSARPHRQSVDDWWQAARRAIGALGATAIDAIALTGTMENLIAVDRAGEPVFDAILYSDPCGSATLDANRARLAEAGAGKILGNAPEPLMTAFKIGWLRDAEPKALARADFLLPGAKDALALRLTGRAVTDAVTATTTGLMDLASRRWSAALATLLSVPMTKLPEILPAGAVIGEVRPGSAAYLGLPSASPIPVVNGCGDVGATTVGSHCTGEGDISLYLGTTGWVARVVAADAPAGAEVYRLAHPRPGLIIEVTPILSAGAAGNWARSILGIGEDARDGMLADADAAPSDLIFLPYLAGERFPFLDTDVRGAFVGLDTRHGVVTSTMPCSKASALPLPPISLRSTERQRPYPACRRRCHECGGRRLLADIVGGRSRFPASASMATAMGGFLIAAETLGLASALGTETIVQPRATSRAPNGGAQASPERRRSRANSARGAR